MQTKYFRAIQGVHWQFLHPDQSLIEFFDKNGNKFPGSRSKCVFLALGMNLSHDIMYFNKEKGIFEPSSVEEVPKKRATRSTCSQFIEDEAEQFDEFDDEEEEVKQDAGNVKATGSALTRSGKRFRAENIVPIINKTLKEHSAEPTNSNAFIVINNSSGTSFVAMGHETQEEILEKYKDRVVTIE